MCARRWHNGRKKTPPAGKSDQVLDILHDIETFYHLFARGEWGWSVEKYNFQAA
jgi:hypothetical protein